MLYKMVCVSHLPYNILYSCAIQQPIYNIYHLVYNMLYSIKCYITMVYGTSLPQGTMLYSQAVILHVVEHLSRSQKSFCSRFQTLPSGRALLQQQLRFFRQNVILPLTIKPIVHMVSVQLQPMQTPTNCWAQTVNQYQLVSTSLNSVSSWVSLPSDKSHLVK